DSGDIAITLLRSPGERVLPEGLVLAIHFDTGHGAGTNVGPQRHPVIDVEVVIKAQRIETRSLGDREVSHLSRERLERRRQAVAECVAGVTRAWELGQGARSVGWNRNPSKLRQHAESLRIGSVHSNPRRAANEKSVYMPQL